MTRPRLAPGEHGSPPTPTRGRRGGCVAATPSRSTERQPASAAMAFSQPWRYMDTTAGPTTHFGSRSSHAFARSYASRHSCADHWSLTGRTVLATGRHQSQLGRSSRRPMTPLMASNTKPAEVGRVVRPSPRFQHHMVRVRSTMLAGLADTVDVPFAPVPASDLLANLRVRVDPFGLFDAARVDSFAAAQLCAARRERRTLHRFAPSRRTNTSRYEWARRALLTVKML